MRIIPTLFPTSTSNPCLEKLSSRKLVLAAKKVQDWSILGCYLPLLSLLLSPNLLLISGTLVLVSRVRLWSYLVSSLRLAPGTQDQFVFPGNDHGPGLPYLAWEPVGWCEIWMCSWLISASRTYLCADFYGQLAFYKEWSFALWWNVFPRNLLMLSTVMDQARPTLSWLWVGSSEFYFQLARDSATYCMSSGKQWAFLRLGLSSSVKWE